MGLFDFLYWHYITGAEEVLRAWFNFVEFGLYLFSVPLLLRTLFSPWRRIEIQASEMGGLEGYFNRLSFNLISRLIGFSVRSVLIFFGLVFSAFFLILGAPIFIIWFFLPFFTWPFYFQQKRQGTHPEKLLKGEAKKFVFQRLGIQSKEELKKINPQDVQAVLDWYLVNKKELNKRKKFWSKENLFKLRAFGTDLAFGFTLELDKCSENLAFPPSFSHQLVGREKEVKQIEAILSRSYQTNLLLVGEPGVGKHTILLELAKAIQEKRVNPKLFYKNVLLMNMNLILAESTSVDQGRARFEQLLKEAEKAGNVILVINQIENYLDNLMPAIVSIVESRHLQMIGVTTPEYFAQKIFPNEEFLKYFEKLEVIAPSKKEALFILEQVLPDFERGKKVIVLYEALKEIIDQSDALITHIPFPEKAIDLLDQLISQAYSEKKPVVTKQDVDRLISLKTKVPVGSLSQNETTKLKNLELVISRRVVNQKTGVTALVKAMRRARVGISETEKPMGSFLFLGPTGVGKTETAKALAQAFFGSDKRILRFDMSQPFSLDLFIRQAREHPFSVLLLDEFEKAKTEIHHLFLTVFDEGYIKDQEGKEVSFKNMIIICTSNAAAEFIRGQVKKGLKEQEVIEYVLRNNIFTPELVNRFDGVIVFKPLDLEQVKMIAQLQVAKLASRLLKKKIKLTAVDAQVYSRLAEEGFNPEFGARPLQRLIADKIETLIAEEILDKKLSKGDTVKLSVNSNKEFKIEKTEKDSYAKTQTP